MAPPARSWSALTRPELEQVIARDPVIVLPVAAIEQHGPHLPLSTDLDIGLGLLDLALADLPPDLAVLALPPLAVGTSEEHAHLAGTLSLAPRQLHGALEACAHGVVRAGARRLVVFNSHGGNRPTVDAAALAVRRRHDALVIAAHYFLFDRPPVDLPDREWRHGLHAGAIETALMLHLHPDAVRRDQRPTAPSVLVSLEDRLRVVGAATGGASFAWLATDLHPSGVTGDARLANADLGHRLAAHYAATLRDVLLDAAEFPLDTLRPR